MNAEVIKGFLLTRVVPPIAGALSTWILTHLHFLGLFHFTHDETAKAIAELLTFGVVTVVAFVAAHSALIGKYVPGKAFVLPPESNE